jgi:hypothetical protein
VCLHNSCYCLCNHIHLYPVSDAILSVHSLVDVVRRDSTSRDVLYLGESLHFVVYCVAFTVCEQVSVGYVHTD